MKLSIIIPVYNVEEYIGPCLDSIVPQLSDSVEVIIVDDGSTDHCSDICDAYAQKYEGITVIHKPNGGLVSARKAGTEIAAGEYIMPVDGDDWLESHAVETVLTALQEYPVDILCYSSYRVSSTERMRGNFSCRSGYYSKAQLEQEIYPKLICASDGAGFPVSIWGKVFRKELYCRFQMMVPKEVSIGEDGLVTLPCVYAANDIHIIDIPLYNYRYNENSITKSRKRGFSWTMPETRVRHLRSVIPAEAYDYEDQFNRSLVHMIFNVAKSHFQAEGAKYFPVRKELKRWLAHPYYAEGIQKSYAKFGSKEWLAELALKHQLIFLIWLYAKQRRYQS